MFEYGALKRWSIIYIFKLIFGLIVGNASALTFVLLKHKMKIVLLTTIADQSRVPNFQIYPQLKLLN